jgi:2-keto-4-pentenoate hydratase/2-oxohepta-3-ene-1,7-dioic acid hydratase in catechol pathway
MLGERPATRCGVDTTKRRHEMMDRRSLLSTGAVMGIGAVAGCATGSIAATGGKPVFEVAQPLLPIVGSSEMFPVRRIYCIGRNYAAHSREMGSDPTREPPFFFQKPSDAIQFVAVGTTADHPYPTLTKNYHYEIELVAALGKGGRNVPIEEALSLVYGYTIGLDMTRRDLQRAMGDQKKPWEIGKSFDRSAPMGPLHRVAQVGHFREGAITLKVNGVVKQSANLNQMIWSVAEQISHLSQANELMPCDIIYSGTPENVGPVVPGDVMQGSIARLPTLDVRVTGTKNA